MTYQEIFEKSREYILAYDVSGIEGKFAIQVDIIGEGEGSFYIELKNGKVSVEPYQYFDHDCKFIITAKDFLSICEGTLDSIKAFTKGKLKIQGNIEKALEFSKIVDYVRKNQNNK